MGVALLGWALARPYNRALMARPRADFVTVFAVLAVTAVVATSPGPLLVVIRDEFGLSFAQLGLIFSAQALAGMLTNIPAGLVADRLPARVPIAAGGVGLGAGTLLMALAPGFVVLLAGSLIGTVGATFMITSSIAYTVAHADAEQRGRATSRVMSGVQVGAFIGPALAGVIAAAFDWRAALIVPAVLSLSVAAVVLSIVRGGAPTRPEREPRMFSLNDLRLPRVVWPIIAVAMLLTGPVVGQSRVVLPLYAGEGLDFTPAVVGAAISAMSAARAVLTFLSGNLMDRAGRGSAFYAMVFGAFGAAVLLTLPLGLGVFIAAGALSAVTGLGAVLPSVLIGDRVPKAYVGRSLGVLLTMGSLVQLGVAPAVGFLLDVSGYELVGVAMAVLMGLAGIIGWRVVGDLPWKRRAQKDASA